MKKTIILLLHCGYWMMYLLLLCGMLLSLNANSNHEPGSFRILLRGLFFSPFTVLTIGGAVPGFYTSYFILFPKLLYRRKIGALILFSLLLAFGFTLLLELFLSAYHAKIMFADGWDSAVSITIAITILTLIHGIIGLVMRGFISWYGDIKVKEELNKKNFEMELALVKSQLNPHFLFNTIHTIDILIEKDPQKASAYLNKLSDIMRFMLYETKAEKIPLTRELTYIEEYIALQKIRTSNQNYVQFTVDGEAGDLLIEPMLFIPFIENAFKHSEDKKTSSTVRIHFSIENGSIIFSCQNHYSLKKSTNKEAGGLGNELIKKRLALLYPKAYSLQVTNSNEIYKVELILTRNEN